MFYSHCSFECNRHDRKNEKFQPVYFCIAHAHMYHHRWRCYRIGRFDLICSKSINIFPPFNQYRYFRFHCHCHCHIYRISMSTFFQTHCTNESNNWLCIWINGKTLKTDIRNKINLPIFPSSSASSSGVVVVVFEPL